MREFQKEGGREMSQITGFKFARTPDTRMDTVFREAAGKWGFDDGTAEVFGGVSVPCGFRQENPGEAWSSVLEGGGFLASQLSMSSGGLTVVFYRGGNLTPEKKSPHFDEIQFHWSGNSLPSTLVRIEIGKYFQKELQRIDPTAGLNTAPTKEQQQLEAIHHETLRRLEGIAEDLVRKTSDYREQLDQRYDEKASKLEADVAAKQAKAETALEELRQALAQDRRALEAQLEVLDTRDNTIVRREIRDGMLSEAKSRVLNFSLSAETGQKRRTVLVSICILLAALLFGIAYTGSDLHQYRSDRAAVTQRVDAARSSFGGSLEDRGKMTTQALIESQAFFQAQHEPNELYWLWGRLVTLSFFLGATLLYLVRWHNAWAERHVQAEFQLNQFHLDVNRASWVLESCLEWKKETDNAAIPGELLSAISRNLFLDKQAQPEVVMHPADELASAILGRAAHIRLKTEGADIDIDKPAKKLAAKVRSSQAGVGA